MALAIYREVSPGIYARYRRRNTTDEELPITSTHDGVLGESVELKLFVRNDDAALYYTNVYVEPIALTSPSDITGIATGHGFKLKFTTNGVQPTEGAWEATSYGNTIAIGNLGSFGSPDLSTYLPFWCRIECPAGAPANNIENVVLRVSGTGDHV